MLIRKRLAAAVLLAAALAGCGGAIEDTREYVQTIGVVIKNDLDSVFDEMYIYPAENNYNSVQREMGPDLIDNTGGVRKKGSYGATIPESSLYAVMIRDHRGGVYEFGTARFLDGDYAVISYEEELTLVIEHRSGGAETLTGAYLSPGDAPSQPYVPLEKQVSFGFVVVNNSQSSLTLISMREADAPEKGEVELSRETLPAAQSVKVSGRLPEEDTEKEWVFYLETADGAYYESAARFDPFATGTVTVETNAGSFEVTFEAA